MIRLLTLVLILATEPTGFVAGQDEAFEPAKVNKWIVALSEDPTQDNDVGELHAYLKKHGKLGLVVLKFEESFDRRPKDAKIRYLLGRLHLRDGNRAAALKCFQSAAQADPDYAHTYLAQAEIFEEQNDEKGLVGALEGVLQSSKDKAAVVGAVRKLAAHYAKRQEHQRGAGLWATVAERFADDVAILREAVSRIDEAGKPALAADCLRAALATKSHPIADRARFFLDLASLERRSGRISDASKSLVEAAKAAIDDPAVARQVDDSILEVHRQDDRLADLSDRYEKDLAINKTNPVYAWRLARVRMAQGQLPQAREILLAGIDKNPGHMLLLTTLADVAEQQGRWTEVRELSLQFLMREPQVRQHRKREGLACLELAKYGEAEACFRAYAATAAEAVEIARLYEKRQRLTDAASWYKAALDMKVDPEWSRALVFLLVRLDRIGDAEQEAARCTKSDREKWALLRDLLLQKGAPEKACVYARKDAEANPKEFDAVFGLAKLLCRVAVDEAEPALRAALVIAKKNQRSQVYEELAGLAFGLKPAQLTLIRGEILLLQREDPNDGGFYYALYRLQPSNVELLEEGRKVDPRHVRLRQELAPYYLKQRQYDLAIDVYRELIEIDPSRRDHYVYAIGEVYWALGHKDAAFSWWAKVEGSAKDRVGLTFQLAKKLEAENRFAQAIELLQQILKQEPDGVLYHWTLAQLYRQVGNFEGLMTEYKWILANSKDEGYLRTARQVVSEKLSEHARAYAEEGSWTRALEEFTEALRYAPNEPATGSLLGHIARCCEHLRDYAKAAEYYHQLLSRFPGVVVSASQGRTMNAALFASLQLRGNPECLKAYEDIVGPLAKDLFEKSAQKGDRAGVERVLTLYPLSRAAGEAAWWLAESWRKEGSAIKAAAMMERLLSEFSLTGLDELLVRLRLVELSASLKDWGTVSTQVGEMAARGKDKVVQVDNRTVAVKEFVQKWQKELAGHGAGGGASWGLAGRDSRNSSSTVQELAPPLLNKWRYQAAPQPSTLVTLPQIYASGGLVYVAKEDVLVALDGSSGNMRWTAPLRVQRTKQRSNPAAQGAAPTLEGRLAVSQGVIAGIDSDNEIRVYDAATGAPVWAKTSDVPRNDGAPAGALRMRSRTVVQTLTEHMELLCATRQAFIVREGDKLRAYSLRTGRIDWQSDVQAGQLPLAIDAGGPSGSYPIKLDRLVLESDGVLVHIYGDSIRALDTQSGKDLWEVKYTGKAGSGAANPWANFFTVIPDGIARAVIAGDALVTLSAGEGKLTAYDLRTGRLRWDQPGDALVTESQLAADDQNLYVLVNKSLVVLSHRTGERLWRREAKTYQPPGRQNMPPPIVVQSRMSIAGSRIYISGSEDQEGDAARIEAIDRKTAKTVWEHPWDGLGKAMGPLRSIGVDMWGRPIPAQSSAPVICDGWLYVVRSDGFLYAFHGKSQELAALRDAVRRDPESPQAHFQLGDLLGSEGQAGLEIEEYRTALKLAQKKADAAAMRDLISELRSRLFVRYMKQGESTTDFEAALKAFGEARAFAEGEASLARVLVRTASVLLALNRELEAVDVLSSVLVVCPSALSPLEGAAETAGDYAKRQLAKLGPQAKVQWEKAHAEEMEKAFAPGKSVEELEKAIERYAFSAKADLARIRAARVHFEAKRYKEAIASLDKVRPEFLEKADAEIYFEAWDLLASALLQSGDDRRALGIYQKMLTEAAKDSARLGSIRERAERRHKELKESWERNGAFGSPLQKIWEGAAPAAKPAGPTLDAFRPAIDRGRIYALDLQGTIQAIDATTLQTIWQSATEDFSYLFQTANGLTVLPVDPLLAVKETVLVVGGKTLRAFDPSTGAPLWSMQSPDGDGVVHQIVLDGNKVYTCETKGRVTARDERTGRLLWSVRPGASATGVLSDRSGMSGGGLFYTRIGAEGGRVVVQSAGDPGTLFAYDVATGKQAWKAVDATYPGYLKGRVELEVGQGMAVLGDSAGLLACHELSDGKTRWKLNLGSPVEGLLVTPDRVLVATADQIVSYGAKSGRKEWAAAPDLNQPFSREKDMRLGATSLAAKGKWLVVGSANSVSILDLATGVVKDQVKSDAAPPAPRPGGKPFPFGRSFASVTLGPEGIFWGVPTDTGTRWTLLR